MAQVLGTSPILHNEFPVAESDDANVLSQFYVKYSCGWLTIMDLILLKSVTYQSICVCYKELGSLLQFVE